jgi:hypothetical protein
MATITAVDMAKQAGITPDRFREALRKENFDWHVYNAPWTAVVGSEEHAAMERVLRELVSAGAIQGEIVRQPSDRPPSGQPPVLKPASAAEEQRARKRIEADIWLRRGQPKFRENLLDAYGRRCAITDCDADDALEAAHIRTYEGSDDNDMRNGILLRADIHTLFDLGLICVRTSTCTVVIDKMLKGTCYESLDGKSVRLPANAGLWHEALKFHRRKWQTTRAES